MKSYRRGIFQAMLALFSIGLASLASIMSALQMGNPRLLALISSVLAVVGAILGFSVVIRMGSLFKALLTLSRSAGSISETKIDIGHLVDSSSIHGKFDSLEGLDSLLGFINDDIQILQRSAKKFDLFSSDILFSAQNLASRACQQLEMLVNLRKQAASYFEGMSGTNEELSGLMGSIAENAKQSALLRESALSSKQELSELITKTRSAAKEAKTGGQEVTITKEAAYELEKDLKHLNNTAKRESEEAKKISESLNAIVDIVERTHILATNASIEAARAGSRGAGFAVIAQEVRKLAASSRAALEDIDRVLTSVKASIDESTQLVSTVSLSAGKLGSSISRSRETFETIGKSILDIETGIDRFDAVFTDQIASASQTAASAESEEARIDGFASAYRMRTDEYNSITSSAEMSENYASEAKRSARVLAQLASYLKVGGSERNRVLQKYRVDSGVSHRRYRRKDSRETLLYNLEVFDGKDSLLGNLGDLSASGLLLLTRTDIPLNSILEITVALPLSLEGEKTLHLRIKTRRSESDSEGYRIGCSFEGGDRNQTRNINELLQSLALESLSAQQANSEPNDSSVDEGVLEEI